MPGSAVVLRLRLSTSSGSRRLLGTPWRRKRMMADGSMMAAWHRLQLSKQFFIILRLDDSIHLDTSRYISTPTPRDCLKASTSIQPSAHCTWSTGDMSNTCPTPCPTHSTFIRIHSNSSAFIRVCLCWVCPGSRFQIFRRHLEDGLLEMLLRKTKDETRERKNYAFLHEMRKWKWRKGSHVVMSSCRHVVMSSCRHVVMSSCRHVVMSSCRHVVMSSCHSHVMTTTSLCFPASKKIWPRLKSQPQRGSMTTCVSGNARAFKKPNDLVRSCEILWGRVRIEMNTNNDDVSVRHVWSLRLSSSAVMRSASNSLFHSALFFFVQKRFRACLNFCALAWTNSQVLTSEWRVDWVEPVSGVQCCRWLVP